MRLTKVSVHVSWLYRYVNTCSICAFVDMHQLVHPWRVFGGGEFTSVRICELFIDQRRIIGKICVGFLHDVLF